MMVGVFCYLPSFPPRSRQEPIEEGSHSFSGPSLMRKNLSRIVSSRGEKCRLSDEEVELEIQKWVLFMGRRPSIESTMDLSDWRDEG